MPNAAACTRASPLRLGVKRMKIIHIFPHVLNPDRADGVAKGVYYLSQSQGKAGHRVYVYSLKGKTRVLPNGQRVDAFAPARHPFAPPPDLTKAIEAVEPDVVHLHSVFVPANVALGRWLRRAGIKYAVSPHGGLSPSGLKRRGILKRVFKLFLEGLYWDRASFVHATSDTEADFIKRYGIKAPVVLAPHGCDSGDWPEPWSLDTGYLEAAYPQAKEKLVFLFLGRLDPFHKGLDILLEAYSSVPEIRERSLLILVGPDWRGRGSTLGPLVRALGLEEKVIFAGPRYGKEKFDLLARCDIFVHPSRWEGMPFSVLEALAMGKPCLITRAVDFGDFFLKYHVGLQVDASGDALAHAIRWFASLPPGELRAMGAAAREAALQEFTWTRTAATLCEAYSKLG
jgi:glycosyltransferase involved in cell wall biosynthesis